MVGISGALLVGAQAVKAAPGDHINLSAGGLMTPGLEISIDLETGLATKRTMRRGTLRPGEEPDWQEAKRQLSPDELQSLKETISRGLSEGLRSKACDEQDNLSPFLGHPPTADSIIVLDVQLQGQSGHSPERDCESPAFDRIWEAAYGAASKAH
jgi:hypothetical protein